MFKLPFKLSIYIAKQFIISLIIVMGTLALIIILIDIVELIRRSGDRDIPTHILLGMGLLKFPLMGQKMIPFAMLISSVLAYTKLTKTHELDIVRSAGVSVWQFLAPAVITAFTIGLLVITILNPIATAMVSKYENLEGKYIRGKTSFLEISQSGLWLRQKNQTRVDNYASNSGSDNNFGETIIHAQNIGSEDNIELEDVTIFVSSENDTFIRRLDAKNAKLLDGFWRLKDVIITTSDNIGQSYGEYFLDTDMTIQDIHDSFASPDTISFWDLPKFIETLNKSGFSALPHRLHWHIILVSPLFYSAMIFIAALFSLRPTRQGRSGLLITGSIVTGFLIYFLTNLISSMGLSGNIPIPIAAWVPVVISILAGVGFLLHFEDG